MAHWSESAAGRVIQGIVGGLLNAAGAAKENVSKSGGERSQKMQDLMDGKLGNPPRGCPQTQDED